MSEESQPLAGMSDAALQALLQRAIRDTLILGLIPAVLLLIASGWRNALMLVVGTLISAASILEWQRLVRVGFGAGSHGLGGSQIAQGLSSSVKRATRETERFYSRCRRLLHLCVG